MNPTSTDLAQNSRGGVRRPARLHGLFLAFCVLLAAIQPGAAIPPQGDDVTPSMGVFRIVVDPLFRPLLSPTGPPTPFVGYLGFHTSDGRLTSPLLIDKSTIIGRSNPNDRFYPFPQPLGAGSWDIINGYGDYPALPFLWFAAPPPTREVLTEIRTFVLSTVSDPAGQHCTNTLVPLVPPNYTMVKAGTFAGVSPRSLGIVQENLPNGVPLPDFPARSFFDIYVEVNLPSIPGTEFSVAFPATGVILTNGPQPLIVTNLNLTSFPPSVIYIHGGNTNAVQLRFKYDNAPYWKAGDLFGTLALAGHGTFTNDCTSEDALIGAVIGTATAPQPEMPTEWLRPNTLCPSPGATYDSLQSDTNPPAGMDAVKFTIPGAGTLYARNFSHGNFPNPINPPGPGNTWTYSASNTVVTCQLSIDGQTWYPTLAVGLVTVKITNTSAAGDPTTFFDTEMLQMDLRGTNSQLGQFMLRESTTKQSLGKHTIRTEPRGFRVSSFFDVILQLSTDHSASWIPADRAIRVQASAPPAAPGSLFVSKPTGGGGALLQWLGPSTLQSAPKVSGTYTDVGVAGGALLNTFSPTAGPAEMYFRLRQ